MMSLRGCWKALPLVLFVLLAASVSAGHASIISSVSIGDGAVASTPTPYSYKPVFRGWVVGPVTVNSEPLAGSWIKELNGPLPGWPRRNGTYNMLEVIQVGSGAAWTGWQETIATAGWEWVKGSIYALSSGAGLNLGSGGWNAFKGLSLLDTGDVTGASIKFDFDPLTTGTWLVIAKTLEWEGIGRPKGSILVSEKMNTVPLPAAAWMLGAGLVGLVALRRRMV